ncbi:MAG: hypothetical protein ABI406_11815 [Ktedonobacteraceae bacterium]
MRPYYSVTLHCALLAVMLSAAQHLTVRRAMLRCTQHDSQHGAMKLDKLVGTDLSRPLRR